MTETLEYIRKNRGQVAKDVSALLSVKHITDIRIARYQDWIIAEITTLIKLTDVII